MPQKLRKTIRTRRIRTSRTRKTRARKTRARKTRVRKTRARTRKVKRVKKGGKKVSSRKQRGGDACDYLENLYYNNKNLKRYGGETDAEWEEAMNKRNNAMQVLVSKGQGCHWVNDTEKARSKRTMEQEALEAKKYLSNAESNKRWLDFGGPAV